MNRKIAFRAWDKEEKRMVNVKELNFITYTMLPSQSLNNVKLMQFTGLLDKNGKEIYESDIVKGIGNEDWTRVQKHVVEFKEGSFGLVWTNEKGYQNFHWFPAYMVFKHKGHSVISQAEIIGNIFENPELLK